MKTVKVLLSSYQKIKRFLLIFSLEKKDPKNFISGREHPNSRRPANIMLSRLTLSRAAVSAAVHSTRRSAAAGARPMMRLARLGPRRYVSSAAPRAGSSVTTVVASGAAATALAAFGVSRELFPTFSSFYTTSTVSCEAARVTPVLAAAAFATSRPTASWS